jgi:hypothetical protein
MSLCNMRAQGQCLAHSKPFTPILNTSISSRRTAVAVTASSKCSKGGCSQISDPVQLSRRDMGSFAASLGMATLFSAFPAAADGEAAPQQYIDPEDAFKLSLPTNWQSSEVCLLTPCDCRHSPGNAPGLQSLFVLDLSCSNHIL